MWALFVWGQAVQTERLNKSSVEGRQAGSLLRQASVNCLVHFWVQNVRQAVHGMGRL
jgi:hypothetical protein